MEKQPMEKKHMSGLSPGHGLSALLDKQSHDVEGKVSLKSIFFLKKLLKVLTWGW